MLLRMVRPVRRKDSRIPYFTQRIPRDLLPRTGGLNLALPIGDDIVAVTLSPTAKVVQLSLRTSDPEEAKLRNAAVGAYVETVWRALRNGAPVPLTHRQATALAGELYRAWASGRERTMTVNIDRATSKAIEPSGDDESMSMEDVPTLWEAARQSLEAGERTFGPLVDRLYRRATSSNSALTL
jgi:hypothetical protein